MKTKHIVGIVSFLAMGVLLTSCSNAANQNSAAKRSIRTTETSKKAAKKNEKKKIAAKKQQNKKQQQSSTAQSNVSTQSSSQQSTQQVQQQQSQQPQRQLTQGEINRQRGYDPNGNPLLPGQDHAAGSNPDGTPDAWVQGQINWAKQNGYMNADGSLTQKGQQQVQDDSDDYDTNDDDYPNP